MKFKKLVFGLIVGCGLAVGGHQAISAVLAPLPDGITEQQVRDGMASSCRTAPTGADCHKFTRLFYCRIQWDTTKCNTERKEYYCNVHQDEERCGRLTEWVHEHGGSSSSSTSSSTSSSGSSSGACPPGTRRGAGGSECHQIPLCEIAHTCGGASSSTSSSSSGASSSSSSSSTSSSSTSSSSTSGGGTHRSGLPWMSGASPGSGKGSAAITNGAGFGAWRGRPIDISTIFIGNNSWSQSYEAYLTNEVFQPSGAVLALKNAGIQILLTIPMVTKADAGKFAMVASGGIDAKHQAVADKIKSLIGDGRIYLRLGHEADEGYPWSYTGHDGAGMPDPANPADYKAAWHRIALIYKRTLPGAKIVWNVLKNTRQKITDYYPGDDVVDILSIDVYDNGSGGYCNSATSQAWIKTCLGSYNPSTGVSKGIGGMLAFAKTHGKKIGVDEWGATNDALAASNGANNSFFVQGMYDFFNANSSWVEYESYYNRAGGGRHQIWPKTDYNPLPSDAYLQKYRP